VNEQSEHLSNAQIENYGNRPSGAGPDADQNDEARINDHLAVCPSCRSHLLDFHRGNFGLLADPQPLMDLQVNTASTPDCPSEDDLRQLAAGLLPEADSLRFTQHSATCGRCGQLLRIYTDLFSDDFSPEEQAVLSQLKSASPDWAEQTAQKMLRTAAATSATSTSPDSQASAIPAPSSTFAAKLRQFFSSKWTLIPATATAAAIAFGVWYTQRDTPEKVELLLAQASTEKGNLEMRIPYAKYSEFNQIRAGESESALNSPPAQRKAGEFIDSHLKWNPDDPKWLLLKARFDLLDWHYKPALQTLEKIADPKVLDSPEFLMTRSLAVYEKAEVQKEKQGYFDAVDLLGGVLQKTPNDPVALFNHAFACEKVSAYKCARGDWERLISIETDPNWSAEARRHLNQIEEKKNLAH
jgi:hypothetical protein